MRSKQRDLGIDLNRRGTRKAMFLEEMGQVVLWAELVALIEPYTPKGGRPAFATETMLRIHFLQQWFTLSDPAMEEVLYDVPLYRQFAGLDIGIDRLPDESTALRFGICWSSTAWPHACSTRWEKS